MISAKRDLLTKVLREIEVATRRVRIDCAPSLLVRCPNVTRGDE